MNKSRYAIICSRGYRLDIAGDWFGLKIANHPFVAKYLAKRLGDQNKILAELCCGIGVTLEYVGRSFKALVGVDKDPEVIKNCETNLRKVGLWSKTRLVIGDVADEKTLKGIQADIAFYDIPYWSAHRELGKGDMLRANPN